MTLLYRRTSSDSHKLRESREEARLEETKHHLCEKVFVLEIEINEEGPFIEHNNNSINKYEITGEKLADLIQKYGKQIL